MRQTKPVTTSVREKGTGKYVNGHIQAVAIDFSRRRERELSTLRTYCRVKVCAYKTARQSFHSIVTRPIQWSIL